MILNIKDLYDWAKEKGYQNFDLACAVINTEDGDIVDEKYLETYTDDFDDVVKVDSKGKGLSFQIYVRF